jgi:predicted ATPase
MTKRRSSGHVLERRPVRRAEEDPLHPADRSTWWARIPAVTHLLDHGLDLEAGITFLVGENGSGKSTIIEALAMTYGLNPEGGSRGTRLRTRESESDLSTSIRLVRSPYSCFAYFLRAETAHGLYTYLEAHPDRLGRDATLHERSHGEGFLDLIERKFDGYGFYLMDEPEAPLSFTSTLSLMVSLDDLRVSGAQIVVATHSPLLTALPGATILELNDRGIRRSEWEELDLVDHWRGYLDRPATYLSRLLD